MSSVKFKITLAAGLACLLCSAIALAALTEPPADVVAAFVIKLSALEKNISSTGSDITVYVIGAPAVAAELEKGVGKAIGSSKLGSVKSGDSLPSEKPSILYVGNADMADQAIAYARSKKILTVTGVPDLFVKGTSLGIVIGSDGKPKVLLNKTASSAEGLNWNPAIIKIAEVSE